MRTRNDRRLHVELDLRWTLCLILLLGFATSTPGQRNDDPAEHYRRAQQAMAARDYETAAGAWKAIIAVAPDLPEARSNLGLVYHLQQDYESAIEQFQEALRQNPRLLAAKVFLGIDYYLTSRPDRAIQELEGARALDPQSALACKWLAMSYVQNEKYANAIAELEACRRLDPEDRELVFHLGRVYRKLSTQAFLAVRRAGLESAWLFLLRGQLFAQQGDTRNALDELRHAARLDPRMPGVHHAVARVLEEDARLRGALSAYAQELDNYPAHLPAAAGLIRTLGKLGLHADAKAVQEHALRFHQGSSAAGRVLAASVSDLGRDMLLSAEDAEQIRESLPRFPARGEQSWKERSLDALLAGRPDEVLQLAESREADGNVDEARYWQARAYLARGQASQALERLMLLHAHQPQNVEFVFFLQACAEKLALGSLELFASLEPESYRIHQLRAEYHAARDDGKRAIAEYTKALALAPSATQLHLAIGSLYLGQRDYEKALTAFQAELKNDAYSVAARARMGEVYFVIGDTDAADTVLKQAIAINPISATPHKTLGRVYFKKREYQKSVEHLQSALRLGIQDDEDLYYHLGRAYQMLGNREEAARNLAIVSRLKEIRRSIAQERLETSVGEPSVEPSGTKPR